MDRISFLGDLMFERPYIKASKKAKDCYDFSGLLAPLKSLLESSDLVVANLETPFAGAKSGYTSNLYSFNTPDEAVRVLGECGINVVTTANNHCLDRGVAGLKRTLEVLHKEGIATTGTYLDPAIRDRSLVMTVNGTRYAFMAYTYGTNTLENKVVLSLEEKGYVNLLKPQEIDKLVRQGGKQSLLRKTMTAVSQKLFSSETRMMIKKMLHMPLNEPIVDDNILPDKAYTQDMIEDIKATIANADVVFMCLHSGGQFNAIPGKFTRDVVSTIKDAGIKHVVATHPHVVQHSEHDGAGRTVFFSTGSLNMSPSSPYVLQELKPQYSIIPHYYFDRNLCGDRPCKVTFSIVKVLEDSIHRLSVWPVRQLAIDYEGKSDAKRELTEDVKFIYQRVTGLEWNSDEILDEYEIR